jgi:hypothetical protein
VATKSIKTAVPEAMQVQLGRLFGAESWEARQIARTAREWKATLRRVLHELDRYIRANVDTDELHAMMIASGLCAADESLKQEDFWPGYAEGITRVVLTLLGNYPDHRRRKAGAKSRGHYSLGSERALHYSQNAEQRFRTLLTAGVFALPGLKAPPRDVLMEFRRHFGSKPTHAEFVQWFKKCFPDQYTAVFS